MEPQWRKSYKHNIRQTLNKHLIPEFGEHLIDQITKADLLAFRGVLARPDNDRPKALSPSRINHVMTPLRMILTEAADRYDFVSPWRNIKPFKVPRTHVEPFDIEEVLLIINTVRPDFKSYYTVRFFTGLRTSEIDGLKWEYVDFKRRQILIREALVMGEMGYTKNDGSFRTVDMSDIVYDALKAQEKVTEKNEFVFCNKAGNPLSHGDITKKVWHPLLRHLGLTKRRPYQTRHTAATLWLAAGESPEWIARQMGHTTTEMLFTVYSRYVPNLTRRDGSAFEKLLNDQLSNDTNNNQEFI
jgi:integrase